MKNEKKLAIKTKKRKKGDIVNIYRNPYKSEDLEGEAELIRPIKQSEYLKKAGFQIWVVKFKEKTDPLKYYKLGKLSALMYKTMKKTRTKRIIKL